jgi:hypothetical protein
MRVIFRALIADKQIQPAVVVEVAPSGHLRWVEAQHTRPLGYIDKPAFAGVAQQGVGVMPLRAHPRAAQHERVDAAIVVVVGWDEIEPARES